MRVLLGVVLAAALAGRAAAAETSDTKAAPGPADPGSLAHEVAGVMVPLQQGCRPARKPPDADVPEAKLVSSFPAQGAVVKPGLMVLRLTYDLPMACPAIVRPNYQFADPCPTIASSMISKDRRTFAAICVVRPGGRYGIWLDATSLAGHKLEPLDLRFSTSDDEKIGTVHDAIAEDPILQAMLGQASAALASPQRASAEPSDSTEVRGLVIQGRLSTVVRGLTITPTRLCLKPREPPDPDVPAPKLVSSFPANGAVVKPGIMVLRLTFDLPMACAGLIAPALLTTNPCPAPLVDPVISKDRRTFMTVCTVEPNVRYGVWLNSPASRTYAAASLLMSSADRNHALRWTNLAGHELASRQVVFTTSSADRVRTLHDAITEDPVLLAMVGPTAKDVSAEVFTGQATTSAPAAESSGLRVLNGLVIEGRLAPELQGLDVRPASECLAAQEPADPAAPPPKLVSSFPADGGKARPGIVVVRLTFDQPMACPGVNDGDLPICPTPLIDPVISADRRTFLTICVARSEGRYSIRLNSERGRRSLSADEHMTVSASQRPRGRWTSLAGRQAVSQEITFTTTNDETVQTIRDAIAEDPFLRDIVGRKTNAAATPSR